MTEIAAVIQRFWELRSKMVLALVLAVIAGLVAVYKVSLLPPHLEKRGSVRGNATAEVLVDSQRSALTNAGYDIEALANRATVFARFPAVPDVSRLIAK